ncbi:uncharacterized protein EV154DRAFT_487451 [Mucor mucedo]|uniref:uncharacterized protein n=1 Tax=Mucor mucedo TaxID=29922 RepID=UPI00222096D7|nr:uncharacterized protein EV154DRAFT_487451 [Mucor mucedo]KAI7873101.1 hypothetical protein EV154DRAFT_487451 [Mucor mucedo]
MPGQEEDLPVLLREEMTLRQTEEIPPLLNMLKEEQGFVELVDSRDMAQDNVSKESCPKLLAHLINLSNSNKHNDHLDRLFLFFSFNFIFYPLFFLSHKKISKSQS